MADLVDTVDAIRVFVDCLVNLPNNPPSLYIDIEGVNLSRHGSISILQVLVLPKRETFLLDIHTLGDKAFSTSGASGQTLKDILESSSIPKVFFDVRNDSDALFSHFSVHLAGIHDLQLMELATRPFSRKRLMGLNHCILNDLQLHAAKKRDVKLLKEAGLILFAPERGGTYEVFNQRPLLPAIVRYCQQDVQFMPQLWLRYKAKLSPAWEQKVEKATRDRVALSQTETFIGKGKHMVLGPW
jgi:exonuclease 3'-5' domain-containing protein 1